MHPIYPNNINTRHGVQINLYHFLYIWLLYQMRQPSCHEQGSSITGDLSAALAARNTCVQKFSISAFLHLHISTFLHHCLSFDGGALWQMLVSSCGTSASRHTATVPITVPTCTVPTDNYRASPSHHYVPMYKVSTPGLLYFRRFRFMKKALISNQSLSQPVSQLAHFDIPAPQLRCGIINNKAANN